MLKSFLSMRPLLFRSSFDFCFEDSPVFVFMPGFFLELGLGLGPGRGFALGVLVRGMAVRVSQHKYIHVNSKTKQPF